MAEFLFILTLICGGAFANEKGHVAVEEKGAKASIEALWDSRKADYSKLND